VFPKCYAAEVITATTEGRLWSVITGMSIACGAELTNLYFRVVGLPSVSSFIKVGAKTKMDYDPRVALPHSVGDGRDKSKWVKPGLIEEGKFTVNVKVPNFGDGLGRFNGVRVTGMVKEVKEDTVDTLHIFFLGLILTWKVTTAEDIESVGLDCTGLFEQCGFIPALGQGQ
jgi:hypothetical protein